MLAPKNRLKRGKGSDNVFKKGKTIAGELIFLKIKKNKLSHSRFAFVVGLKISKKSTTRNKIRRQLRGIIKKNLSVIKSGFDIIIITKPEVINEKYQEIEKETKRLFKKAGVYK